MTRLLVTGATGYTGSAVIRQALAGDYQENALTRSERAAARLTSLGAIPVPVADIAPFFPASDRFASCGWRV